MLMIIMLVQGYRLNHKKSIIFFLGHIFICFHGCFESELQYRQVLSSNRDSTLLVEPLHSFCKTTLDQVNLDINRKRNKYFKDVLV